ncbi:hypothetical protein [Rhodoferax sp.]|uniref:hypothetical protein n=1 Tax=Rhodoferax sp. TaxID=50421 RepID=UPI0025DD704F|nr:hypothetical protein [Rhodoferax sp.]
MGIASFSPTGLLGSFQGLVGWLTASAPHKRAQRPTQASRPAAAWTPNCANHPSTVPAWPTRPSCNTPPPAAPRRPVRVLRVIDTPQSAASAGRMRISGRMADVCAELDRMAALESTARSGPLLQ